MKYTSVIVDDREHCLEVMSRMEEEFKKGDERFFIKVMQDEPSLVLRVHAVTILADLGSQAAIPTLSKVLLNDPDPLVRHEAAFTMGQIGLASAVGPLEEAVLKDKDPNDRHESAAALGSIGSQLAKGALEKAMSDPDELVRNSAAASPFNLEFLKTYEVGGTARDRAPRP
jgi:deoxyhypusine monooxygenase